MAENQRVLFVDDDPRVLSAIRRHLRRDYDLVLADDGAAGLDVVREGPPFAVVVSDMHMPGMDGAEFLSRLRKVAPETVRMMLTGASDLNVAMEAVNSGNIFRFMNKPTSPDDLKTAVRAGVRQHQLLTAEKELLDRTLTGSVRVLSEVLSVVNPTAFGRSTRAHRVVQMVAAEMGEEQSWALEVAARMSQVGCVTVPEELLQRQRNGELLSDEEKRVIAEHPKVGGQMLGKIPRLDAVAQAIVYQGKRYGGGGHPADSVHGEDIPFGARILKLALDFEALVTSGVNPVKSIQEMESRAGWYDPRMLDALRESLERGREQHRAELMIQELDLSMIVDQDVYATDDTLLVSRGTEITQPLLRRLDNWERLGRVEGPFRVVLPPDDPQTVAFF